MRTWITSDIHFGHKKILEYYPKTRLQFGSNVEEMDLGLIDAWNQVISPQDKIFILGDISFYGLEKTIAIVNQLYGQKHLILGNHDFKLAKQPKFISLFESVDHYFETKFNKDLVVMMHFPIADWNHMQRGSIHFHGHCHGAFNGLRPCRALDVGVDATGRIAVEIEEMIELAKTLPVLPH